MPPRSKHLFPPDVVGLDMLAYRLNIPASQIEGLVARGLLPRPISIGNLKRWRWSHVEAHLDRLGGAPESDADPYLVSLNNGSSADAEAEETDAG